MSDLPSKQENFKSPVENLSKKITYVYNIFS